MAGIGFELSKLFEKKGLLSTLRACGYAGIVCAGPMILGVVLLLGIRLIAGAAGASDIQLDLLVSMITYALLASMVLTSILSMITTRYAADMIYMEKPERILPSFYGSTSILLVVGGIAYGVFLLCSGIPVIYQLFCLVLMCELIVIWMQINYITALKDYRKVLLTFFTGIVSTLLCGLVFMWMHLEVVSSMLLAVCIGYGIMMTGYFLILHRYFPQGQGSAFRFLEWIDKYPSLTLVGFFLTVGLFAHFVIIWFSPIGVHVQGLFYGAPQYDIPALLAFFSVLATTINFVTTVEVKFYPKYKQYFALLNGGGTIEDVELAENDMLTVLRQQLNYLGQKQFVVTVLFIALCGSFLLSSYLGFNESMLGTFRILCVGYGLYAVGNSIMLSLLYFADNTGAFWCACAFMIGSVGGTLLLADNGQSYYGFGFLIGAVLMYVVAWVRLGAYTKKLQYHVLCGQPDRLENNAGFFLKLNQKIAQRGKQAKKEAVTAANQSTAS